MRCIQRDNDSGGSSWERFFLTRPRELTKYHRGSNSSIVAAAAAAAVVVVVDSHTCCSKTVMRNY